MNVHKNRVNEFSCIFIFTKYHTHDIMGLE